MKLTFVQKFVVNRLKDGFKFHVRVNPKTKCELLYINKYGVSFLVAQKTVTHLIAKGYMDKHLNFINNEKS